MIDILYFAVVFAHISLNFSLLKHMSQAYENPAPQSIPITPLQVVPSTPPIPSATITARDWESLVCGQYSSEPSAIFLNTIRRCPPFLFLFCSMSERFCSLNGFPSGSEMISIAFFTSMSILSFALMRF